MPPEPGGRATRLRLALAPDAPLVMAGTADMLARVAPEIEVICLADTSEDPGRVDFIVYDPQRHDTEELTQLTRTSPDALTVAFSWSTRPDLVDEAHRQGAAGFLSKELSADEVVTALRALRAGHHVRFLVQPYAPVPQSSTSGRPNGLTERELEVLELVTAGRSNDEIAKRLFLSINSVKSYIRTGYRKIGATRRTQAVLWGVEHGLATREGQVTATDGEQTRVRSPQT
jgi:NarL family two-component system response regulator LiaR